MILVYIIIILLIPAIMVLTEYKLLHYYQLSSYKLNNFYDSLKNNKFKIIERYFYLFIINFIILLLIYCATKNEYASLGLLFFVGLCLVFTFLSYKESVKIPLKLTQRLKRYIVIDYFVNLIFTSVIVIFMHPAYFVFAVLILFLPIFMGIAHYIDLPIEKYIANKYLNMAEKKLESNPNLIKIAITGSYGKTTAKNILVSILESKHKVCSSPLSYNTPMGLCKTINEFLRDDDEILVAEMGARHVGDIDELVQLIKPKYAIITNVGNQHLETFGNPDNIMKTKFEIANCFDEEGLLIIPNNEKMVAYAKSKIKSKYKVVDDIVTAKILTIDENGTRFILKIGNNEYELATKLLGRHIVELTALSAALAIQLGIKEQEIISSVQKMRPVQHRLEIIKNENSMTIIDDSYNCNFEGLKNALEVLACFNKLKIIITPGLVELGYQSSEQNQLAGYNISKVCDYAFFSGPNKEDLKKGALQGDMKEENIIFFEDLDFVISQIEKIQGEKVLLFENDLPDNFAK